MIDIETARSWYPANDPVHGFDHILRVYRMAEQLAIEEGADLDIVHAAALLHDAQGSQTEGGEEGRHDHHHASSESVSYTHLRAHETAYTISYSVFCV